MTKMFDEQAARKLVWMHPGYGSSWCRDAGKTYWDGRENYLTIPEHNDGKNACRFGRGKRQTLLDDVQIDDAQPAAFEAFDTGERVSMDLGLASPNLAKAIKAVLIAVGEKNYRYYLKGACIASNPATGAISLVSTNGHMLVNHAISGALGGHTATDIILHTDTLRLIAAMCARYGAPVRTLRGAADSARAVLFEWSNGVTLQSAGIDGTFPDFQRVIPSLEKNNTHTSVSVNALVSWAEARRTKRIEELREAFKIQDARAKPNEYGNKGKAWNEASAAYSSALSSRVDCEPLIVTSLWEGIPMGFTQKYMRAIASVFGDTLQIHAEDASGPVLINPSDTALAVLMPLRPDSL